VDGLSTNTLDHLADVIAQATTEKLIVVALILFLSLLLATILLFWRIIPILRHGNQERTNLTQALEKQHQVLTYQNELIVELRKDINLLHRMVTERKGWFRWLIR
jgi:sensor c-di-GMP phosphodiesterase-like protein